MNRPPPPPIPAASLSSKSFPKQAASFSLIAPFVAIAMSIVTQPQMRGNRWSAIILGTVFFLIIVLGFSLGIAALIATRTHGRQGIFGRALTGTCICGLLLILSLLGILVLRDGDERAKAIEKQRIEQLQP